jgi:hypothetical protein
LDVPALALGETETAPDCALTLVWPEGFRGTSTTVGLEDGLTGVWLCAETRCWAFVSETAPDPSLGASASVVFPVGPK